MQSQTQDRTVAIGLRVAARRVSPRPQQGPGGQPRPAMSAAYLEYVEDQGGRPSAGVLRRLAEVLHTTVEHLYGEAELEPDRQPPHDVESADRRQKHLVARLSPAECRLLMGSVPVGRVAFVVNGPPLVLPVNFTLMGEEIVIQTATMSPLAELARAGRLVSFEADDIDEASRLGWSVLCHGRVTLSTEQGEHDHQALSARPAVDRRRPAHGRRDHTKPSITGRRIGLA